MHLLGACVTFREPTRVTILVMGHREDCLGYPFGPSLVIQVVLVLEMFLDITVPRFPH